MAAAIAASLNQVDPAAANAPAGESGQAEGQSAVETEQILMMIAQRESALMEKDRQAIERLKANEEERLRRTNKTYDDIIFDASMIESVHPRLHAPLVHTLQSESVMDKDSILIDGEFFLAEDQEAGEAPAEGEAEEQKED